MLNWIQRGNDKINLIFLRTYNHYSLFYPPWCSAWGICLRRVSRPFSLYQTFSFQTVPWLSASKNKGPHPHQIHPWPKCFPSKHDYCLHQDSRQSLSVEEIPAFAGMTEEGGNDGGV